MTTMAEATSPTSDGSPSWLKQRSSIFNSNTTTTATNNKSAPKVVDKELARLKNVGAVSSIWSNKFVQEDSNISGGTTEYNIKRISPPLTTTEPTPPLSPRQHQRFVNIDMSPRPNANYIPPGNNFRQSVVSPTPSSPNGSIRSSRTLSGVSLKRMTVDEKSATAIDIQQQQAETKSSNNFGYFSKNSMSSLDLNEESATAAANDRSSVASSVTSSVLPSPIKQTVTEGESAAIAEPTTTRSHSNSVSSSTSVTIDDAASLWFQCETLKTQYAQSNARLTRANEDIEFYKRQLEQQGEVSRQGIATANEEKDKELLRVRQLAELIVKQDRLLGEYEINLDVLTRLTNESAYLEETQAEMNELRQELATLKKKKEQMEGAIEALKAELEMSYSQMRLMMVVSTEIQNEFDSYKEQMDLDIKQMMKNKQVEHEAELKALQEKFTSSNAQEILGSTDRSVISSLEEKKDDGDVAEKVFAAAAAATATAAAATAVMAAEHEKALSALVDRVTILTEALEEKDKAVSVALQEKDMALKEKDKALAEALAARDNVISKVLEEKEKALAEARHEREKAINELEYQLKTQKMSMDAKMMMLNQTILEKDNLLMEFMSSRNNSREVISAAASMSSSPTSSSAIPAATVTNTYYHQQSNSEARIQITQARDYMFSTTDDESSDDDEAEVMRISYSSEEEEDEEQNHIQQHHHQQQQQNFDHYQHLNENRNSGAPQSPAETISSTNSFESDEEEEKVAEIKHFSYSSVQSQATRPVSLISTTESLTTGMMDLPNNNKTATATPPAETNTDSNRDSLRNSLKNSSTAPFNVAKETNAANWPMPPPTPPPSEPLPPVPVSRGKQEEGEAVSIVKEDSGSKPNSPITTIMNSIPAPPRRVRSKTMARDEAPDMSVYTTSVHQTNELPRIIPVQKSTPPIDTTPVPPPRKDLPSINIVQASQAPQQQEQGSQQQQHTKWMDDPESSEDDEVWSEANTSTPTKQKPQEWTVL